jgi:hypothetical protein
MAEFRLTTSPDFYTLEGITLQGKPGRVEIAKELVNNSLYRTQEEWAALPGLGQHGSGPLIYSVLSALYDHRDDKSANSLISHFTRTLEHYGLETSTRIYYQPSGLALIKHDYGLPSEQTLEMRFPSVPFGICLGDIETPEITQALLGEKNPVKASMVFEWFSEHVPRLWYEEFPPSKTETRKLWLHCYHEGFIIDANCRIGKEKSGYPVRGMTFTPQ